MKKLLWLLILLMAITACAPSESVIQTAIALTQAAAATSTPTNTPTYTLVSTRTITPTLTPSNTPLAATLTAIVMAITQTQAAHNKTATIEAINATSTRQALNISMTQVANAYRRTATAAVLAEMAQYKTIYRKELVSYPDAHQGEKLKVTGRVFNITGDDQFQMWIESSYDAVIVVTRVSFSGLYEDDYVTVYGIGGGEYCGENAMGAQICQPVLIDAFYTKP